MKVQSIQLKYFKKFEDYQFDLTNSETGLASDIILIIGMNGAGKTSLLQAIAATLGVATRRLEKLSDLEWAGFNYELLSNNWRKIEPEVNLQIQFSSPELKYTSEFYQKLQDTGHKLEVPPAAENVVSLRWKGEGVQTNKTAELFQFKGREYAKQLLRSEGFQVFEKVGTILWYTEQRTSTSLTPENNRKQLEITEDILELIKQFRKAVDTVTQERFEESLEKYQEQFAQEEFWEQKQYLIWFHGKDIQKEMQRQKSQYISLNNFGDWAVANIDIDQHPDLRELQIKIEQL